MVNVDDLLKKFVQKSERKAKKFVRVKRRMMTYIPMKTLLRDWRKECRRLKSTMRRGEGPGKEKEDS